MVGCGNFANAALLPCVAFAPLELVAVCDQDVARAEQAARRFGAQRSYGDYREMIRRERLDAVMAAVGPAVHLALAMEAMQAGLHVYVEKPPALTVKDAERMAAARRETGRSLAVGFMKRFATAYRMAKQITGSPGFGRLAQVSLRFTTGVYVPAWAGTLTPLALLLDHSIHHLDLVQHFAGPAVWACAQRIVASEERFGFATVVRFAGGTVGLLEFSNLESRGVPNERVQVTGEGCSVVVDNVTRLTYQRHASPMDRSRELDPDRDSLCWMPNMTAISVENSSLAHMGYLGQMRNFADAVLRGERAKPDIEDAVLAMRLARAVYESDGRPMELGGEG